MSSSRSTPLAAFVSLLQPLYLACSALVAIVWLSGFGAGTIADPDFVRKVPNPDLRAALGLFSHALDATWITLGAVNFYLALARTEGLATARRWSALILSVAIVFSAASVATGFPLGPVYFPTNLGMKIGPIPLALPFLWLTVIGGARATVLGLFPRLSYTICAPITGLCCALTSLLLDPIAWKYRAWWLWYPAQINAPVHAPWSAPLTWFIVGAALTFVMRPTAIIRGPSTRSTSPMVGYIALNAIAFLTIIVR